jgi:hypothetical protein
METTMKPRTPPHDTEAERAVLGSMLLSPDAVAAVERITRPTDFYDGRHRRVYEAIQTLRATGRPVDALQVKADLEAAGEMGRLGPTFLFDLIEQTPSPASAEYYARIVRDRAKLREAIAVASRLDQMAFRPGVETADTVIERAAEEINALKDYGTVDDLASMRTLDELTDGEETPYDWLIPGLLEKGDRVLLTGSEGLGKTMLTRQFAVCAAAGLHPLTQQEIPPMRVLVVDCENGDKRSQRAYRYLRRLAEDGGYPVPSGSFFCDIHPQGLDLATVEDRRWLMRRVEVARPDLLVIGPIYKLHVGNANEEETARSVAVALDQARSVSGCSLIAETHSVKGSDRADRPLEPFGSSLWLRWPEFGMGISVVASTLKDKIDRQRENEHNAETRYVDVIPWRGHRDEGRDWPDNLRSGAKTPRRWPWIRQEAWRQEAAT